MCMCACACVHCVHVQARKLLAAEDVRRTRHWRVAAKATLFAQARQSRFGLRRRTRIPKPPGHKSVARLLRFRSSSAPAKPGDRWKKARLIVKTFNLRSQPTVLTIESALLGWYISYGVYFLKNDGTFDVSQTGFEPSPLALAEPYPH